MNLQTCGFDILLELPLEFYVQKVKAVSMSITLLKISLI